MKRFGFLALCVLAFALMWVYSHDYAVKKINQQTQNRLQALSAGQANFHWKLSSLNEDVVKGYRSSWRPNNGTLEAISGNAKTTISLKFNGYQANTDLYNELFIDLQSNQPVNFKIEINSNNPKVFYYSENLIVEPTQQKIDFSKINWRKLIVADSEFSDINWSEITTIYSLVLRFDLAKGQNLSIIDILLAQNKPMTFDDQAKAVKCDYDIVQQTGLIVTECWLNNQIAYLYDSVNVKSTDLMIKFNPYNAKVLPELWLMAAALFFSMALMLVSQGSFIARIRTITPILTTLLIILSLSMSHWVHALNYYKFILWPILLVLLLVVTYKKKILFGRYSSNLKTNLVWLIPSAVLAVFMWVTSEYSLKFYAKIPLYLLWATVQQILLGPIVSEKIKAKLNISQFQTAVISGLLFSLIHTPNQMIMLVTFIAGVFWSWSWLRYRCLTCLVISHTLLALLFYQVMPAFYLYSARVGSLFLY